MATPTAPQLTASMNASTTHLNFQSILQPVGNGTTVSQLTFPSTPQSSGNNMVSQLTFSSTPQSSGNNLTSQLTFPSIPRVGYKTTPIETRAKFMITDNSPSQNVQSAPQSSIIASTSRLTFPTTENVCSARGLISTVKQKC